MEGTVILKPGREKPVRNRHPWIFSGAIRRVEGAVEDGDLVRVTDSRGRYLATGYLNRRSQIVVRLLTWDPGEKVDSSFWRHRLAQASDGRARLAQDPKTDAYRLVHAEADGLPGLVVDRYGDWLVVQCLTLGMARRRDEIVSILADSTQYPHGGSPPPAGIYARDDAGVRKKEGSAVGRGATHPARDCRCGPALSGGRVRGPQDRLLPRPKGQPAKDIGVLRQC